MPAQVQASVDEGQDGAADDVASTTLEAVDPRNYGLTQSRIASGISLDGTWQYIVDPQEMGFRRGRMRRFHSNRIQQGQELLEYEWSSAPEIQVPGDWNSQVESLKFYDGIVWFYRPFDTVPTEGRRQFIHFEAVNRIAYVYVNGEKLAEHHGGFTPFSVEITDVLKDEDNFVVVGVDSRHDETTVPTTKIDWWNYGGITRSVTLIDTPETFIRNYKVALEDDVVRTKVWLDGEQGSDVAVSVVLPNSERQASVNTDANGYAELTLPADGLALWSPDEPQLHAVELSVAEDRIEDRIGLRTVEARGNQIFLNGEPIFMRGIALHEEPIGPVGTRRIDEDGTRRLLEEAKALNANFVRLAHYPHGGDATRLADEMGLLVWSEIPVYWDMAFSDPDTLSEARNMLTEMILRDWNQSSVVIWSVGNETPQTDDRLVFMRALIDHARALDPTRMISAAMHDDADDSSGPEGKVTVDDPIGNYIDVLAMNRYEAWYGYRNPTQIDEVNWVVPYDKPLIFSEFGAGALYGFRADPLVRWSEDYQEAVFVETLEMADRIPNLAGTSPWLLKDFRSPRRFHGTYQDYWNRKGVIDPEGNRKAAWDDLADYYARRKAAE